MTLDMCQIERTFRLFAEIDGEIPAKYRPFLRAAEAEILRRLKPCGDIAPVMERLCDAAAAVAYHGCRALEAVNACDIKVGDIALSAGAEEAKAAEKLKEAAMAGIADLLQIPEAFALVTAEVKL